MGWQKQPKHVWVKKLSLNNSKDILEEVTVGPDQDLFDVVISGGVCIVYYTYEDAIEDKQPYAVIDGWYHLYNTTKDERWTCFHKYIVMPYKCNNEDIKNKKVTVWAEYGEDAIEYFNDMAGGECKYYKVTEEDGVTKIWHEGFYPESDRYESFSDSYEGGN